MPTKFRVTATTFPEHGEVRNPRGGGRSGAAHERGTLSTKASPLRSGSSYNTIQYYYNTVQYKGVTCSVWILFIVA